MKRSFLDVKKLRSVKAKRMLSGTIGGTGGWDGQGHLTRLYSWYEEMVADHTIDSQPMDAEFDNITVAGFNNTLTRDGQGSATADLPFNGFKLYNLGEAWGDLTSAVTVRQLMRSDVMMYGSVVESTQSAVVTLDALHSSQKQVPDAGGMTLRAYFFALILDKNITADSANIVFKYTDNYPDISAYQVRGMDGYQFPANTLYGGIPYLVMLKSNSVYIGRLAGGSGGGGGTGGGIQTITSPKQSITISNIDPLNPAIDVNLGMFPDSDDLLHIEANVNGRDWYFRNKYRLYSNDSMLAVADIHITESETRRGQTIDFVPSFGTTDGTITAGTNANGQMIFKNSTVYQSSDSTLDISRTSLDTNVYDFKNNVQFENYPSDDSIDLSYVTANKPRIRVNPAYIGTVGDNVEYQMSATTTASPPRGSPSIWVGIIKGDVSTLHTEYWYRFDGTFFAKSQVGSTSTQYRSYDFEMGFKFGSEGTLLTADANSYCTFKNIEYGTQNLGTTLKFAEIGSQTHWWIMYEILALGDGWNMAEASAIIHTANTASRSAISNGWFEWDLGSTHASSSFLANANLKGMWLL